MGVTGIDCVDFGSESGKKWIFLNKNPKTIIDKSNSLYAEAENAVANLLREVFAPAELSLAE